MTRGMHPTGCIPLQDTQHPHRMPVETRGAAHERDQLKPRARARPRKRTSVAEFLVFTLPLLIFLVVLYGTVVWNFYVSTTNWVATAARLHVHRTEVVHVPVPSGPLLGGCAEQPQVADPGRGADGHGGHLPGVPAGDGAVPGRRRLHPDADPVSGGHVVRRDRHDLVLDVPAGQGGLQHHHPLLWDPFALHVHERSGERPRTG